MDEAELEKSMEMIVFAGDAETQALEAIDCISEGNSIKAKSLFAESRNSLKKAHAIHKDLLQKIMNGEKVQPDLILVHAMDHLTAAETYNLIGQKMLNLFGKYINTKEAK
ncbi:MAG: PTS lactose/cellobiose transporter subunit IIA [Treponema sp.]|jgi:PTS system cellobiose-specific IIA component|nr:PTS lactose/cellobiose transporter subunit IIA [Treponema sp.]